MTPAERVAFILHDVFRFSFAEVAGIVGRTPAACRQLASSARRRIRVAQVPAASVAGRADVVRAFKQVRHDDRRRRRPLHRAPTANPDWWRTKGAHHGGTGLRVRGRPESSTSGECGIPKISGPGRPNPRPAKKPTPERRYPPTCGNAHDLRLLRHWDHLQTSLPRRSIAGSI
ncbi:sigma factor-like helix-turn-helix DNA-binding protein [Phytohabitans rumicis]|uniref:sigma factor-like helix-turn-helix DNA-binding protein n=1 Tax=Phytohabitans rumicis TaxID=1076125 RepID=UPI001FEC55B1|nr:sigma factor-like helix-turn-helix DNA-binding protein [Phytohabitans rumicis]